MKALRRAALVAVLAGQAGAWTAGVLALPLLGLALVATVLCAALSSRLPERRRRPVSTGLALVLAVVTVPQLAIVGGTGGTGGLREVLGPLLVGISAVQPLSWEHRRDLQTALLTAAGLLVLGASFAPDILIGAPLLIGVGAVLVGGVLASQERSREGADLVVRGGANAVSVAVPAALVGVLGLVLFLLVPLPQGAGASSRIAGAAGALGASGRAAPGAYSGDRVDLRVRGDLGDRPLLDVPDDSPELWRSRVYPDWDGTGWTTTRQRRALLGGRVEPPAGPTRTDLVRPVRRADGVVFSPGPIVDVDLVGPATVDEFGAVLGPTWPEYSVTSAVLDAAPALLRRTTGQDISDPRWLALPTSVPERVRAQGRELAAGSASRIDTVLRVETWLDKRARYQLDSPVPAPGEDAVDRFLFVDRVGFCEQFAAAEVLLLRSAGIPARFVTGIGYGESVGGGRRILRERNLHAWIEVYHPGVGWVTSDPTPPSTQLAGASLRVRLAAKVTAALRQAESVPGGRPTLAVGLLSLIALSVLLSVVRRRPTRPLQAQTKVGSPGPALAAFLRWQEQLGSDRRRPGETLAELAARLEVAPELSAALQVVEQECYAPEPPDPRSSRDAVAALSMSPSVSRSSPNQ